MVVCAVQRAHICHESAEGGDVESLSGLPCWVQRKIEGVLPDGARANMRNLNRTQVRSIPVHSSMEKLVTRQSHGLLSRGISESVLLSGARSNTLGWSRYFGLGSPG